MTSSFGFEFSVVVFNFLFILVSRFIIALKLYFETSTHNYGFIYYKIFICCNCLGKICSKVHTWFFYPVALVSLFVRQGKSVPANSGQVTW